MTAQNRSRGIGWKLATIAALALALFAVTSVPRNDKLDAVFKNHERRLDPLESMVRGSVGKAETHVTSHERRIEELLQELQALKAQVNQGELR